MSSSTRLRRLPAAAGLAGLPLLLVSGPPDPAHAESVADRDSPIVATLKGRDNGVRDDQLKVVYVKEAAGAGTKLFRLEDGGRTLVGEGSLDEDGRCRFVVEDLNGKRRTRYVAKVLATDDTAAQKTNVRRVR